MSQNRKDLLAMAYAARGRLQWAIDSLENEDSSDTPPEELHGRFVRDVHGAVFSKSLRWLLFVDALELVTARTSAKPTDAADVIARYAEVFPDAARKLEPSKVAAAIAAWRADVDHWKAVRAALVDATPTLPNARSMATQWSTHTKDNPGRVPSKNRAKRRPKTTK